MNLSRDLRSFGRRDGGDKRVRLGLSVLWQLVGLERAAHAVDSAESVHYHSGSDSKPAPTLQTIGELAKALAVSIRNPAPPAFRNPSREIQDAVTYYEVFVTVTVPPPPPLFLFFFFTGCTC